MIEVERRYKTYKGFSAALKKLAPKVIHWYGSDHYWVIVIRKGK